MISATKLKNGISFEIEGKPYQVVKYAHNKVGRGGATVRVSLRNLKTGNLEEHTYNSTNKFEEISTQKRKLQYLYNDGTVASFMDPRTYEQIEIDLTILGDSILFIKEGAEADVLFWDPSASSGQVALSVDIPAKVTLEVLDTAPGVKGNSATNIYKPAKLENGLSIKVPLFIKIGEKIRVDTRTSAYIERVAE